MHVLHMGGRRSKGPKEKRGGLSLDVDHWSIIDKLTDMRTRAWKRRGGESKQTTSGELGLAIASHYAKCKEKYGPWPTTREEEEAYVKKMAEVDERDALAALDRAS